MPQPVEPPGARCPDDACVPTRSGVFCLVCGRSFLSGAPSAEMIAAAIASATGVTDDADDRDAEHLDPNYWIYLMHDPEIVPEDEPPALSAGLAFYGRAPSGAKRATGN